MTDKKIKAEVVSASNSRQSGRRSTDPATTPTTTPPSTGIRVPIFGAGEQTAASDTARPASTIEQDAIDLVKANQEIRAIYGSNTSPLGVRTLHPSGPFVGRPERTPAEQADHDYQLQLETRLLQHATKGIAYAERQRERARKPRAKVSDDGDTVSDILSQMMANAEFQSLSAKEAWAAFIGKLDLLNLNPTDTDDGCAYDTPDGKRRKMGFRTFQNRWSKARKSK